MALHKDALRRALAGAAWPDGTPLGDLVRWVASCDGVVNTRVFGSGRSAPDLDAAAASIRDAAARAHTDQPLRSCTVEFVDEQGAIIRTARPIAAPTPTRDAPPAASAPSEAPGHRPIPGLDAASASPLARVGSIIAVGAGKGGVGKSTIAANLAVGLARAGRAVGLLDADIYGPSMPTVLGLGALEQCVVAGRLQPHAVHGIKAVTIGKLVEPEKPLIWRGPMAHGAFRQLAEQTDWGELDELIIDLPPGTGDVALTMAQTLRLAGAVIVCTPQRVAQDDAVRAVRMFQQLRVEVLGVIENMSYFVGDDGKEYDIFGRGGAEVMAQRLGIPFLASIPITMALRANTDDGAPTRNFDPRSAGGEALPRAIDRMVANVRAQLALASLRAGHASPTLSIS